MDEQLIDQLLQDFEELDTSSISDALDALGIEGVLAGLSLQTTTDGTVAGQAFTVRYAPMVKGGDGVFHNAGNYIDDVPAGSFIVVDTGGTGQYTNWGNILTTKAIATGIKGTALQGAARDIAEIREMRYPVFSNAVTMVSGKNRSRIAAVQVPVRIGNVEVRPGDIVVGDANGVLRIPRQFAGQVLTMAQNVTGTERDIMESIGDGGRLDTAREDFGYSTPWSETHA